MMRVPSHESIRKAKVMNARYKLPRKQILAAFDLVRFPNGSTYTIKNLMQLLDERDDLERVNDLISVYVASFPNSRDFSPTGFYYHYKKNWFTTYDALALKIYEQILPDFTAERVNVWPFMGAGEALVVKLTEWATSDATESPEELLALFFYLTLPQVKKFQEYLLVQPKSVLSSYGWHTFLREVDRHGDKWNLLTQSAEKQQRKTTESERLLFLQKIRRTLLDEGDREIYDTMGKQISRLGERVVFGLYNLTFETGETQ